MRAQCPHTRRVCYGGITFLGLSQRLHTARPGGSDGGKALRYGLGALRFSKNSKMGKMEKNILNRSYRFE